MPQLVPMSPCCGAPGLRSITPASTWHTSQLCDASSTWDLQRLPVPCLACLRQRPGSHVCLGTRPTGPSSLLFRARLLSPGEFPDADSSSSSLVPRVVSDMELEPVPQEVSSTNGSQVPLAFCDPDAWVGPWLAGPGVVSLTWLSGSEAALLCALQPRITGWLLSKPVSSPSMRSARGWAGWGGPTPQLYSSQPLQSAWLSRHPLWPAWSMAMGSLLAPCPLSLLQLRSPLAPRVHCPPLKPPAVRDRRQSQGNGCRWGLKGSPKVGIWRRGLGGGWVGLDEVGTGTM